MAMSCIVCEIQRVSGRKSQNFCTPPVFNAHVGDNPVEISRRCLMLIKVEWLRYLVVKKLWQYVKLLRYNTGMWQTDGQTEFMYEYRTSALLCWCAVIQNWCCRMKDEPPSLMFRQLLLLCRVRTWCTTPWRTPWQYFSTIIRDACRRIWHTSQVVPRVVDAKPRVTAAPISGRVRELTDWPCVVFPFSIECQHLKGCDCRRPLVSSCLVVILLLSSCRRTSLKSTSRCD